MKTYAFIDASNLFYGGEKSLGWKIDYKKLIEYLKEKYDVSQTFYFGGVEIHILSIATSIMRRFLSVSLKNTLRL